MMKVPSVAALLVRLFFPLLACGLAGCDGPPYNNDGPPPMAFAPGPGAQIVSSSGACLDVAGGGAADGTPLILFHCHGSPNQRWVFANNQVVGIGGSCLDVQGGSAVDGSPIILFHCTGSPSQRWSLSNGEIVGVGGKCLDLLDEGSADRTPAILTPCRGASGQQWSIQ